MGFLSSESGFIAGENCSTLDYIYGKKIVRSLGLIQYTTSGFGDVTEEMSGILRQLLYLAHEAGANAVVNVKLLHGFNSGTQSIGSYVTVYGDAVVVEEDAEHHAAAGEYGH
jgi:uncharacterized protein YbjQ (UPF0145 family)